MSACWYEGGSMNITTINRTLSMLGQIFDPRRSTKPVIELPAGKPSFSRMPEEQPLQRVSPEAAGVPSAYLEAFVRELVADKTLRMHNLMILRGGKVIFETSFGGQDMGVWKYTFSACKSIIALGIGLLVDEGKLKPEDKLIDFFPENISPVNRLRMKDISIRHLLTMTSTVMFSEAESVTEKDWVKGFFNSVTSGELGKTFNYNSLNTYMLAAVICKVSGESVSSYLGRKLFAPLGITNYYWETCPGGIEKGGWGLYILPEDMAKLGQLVMQRGRWKRRRIVSAEWIAMATSEQMTAPGEYGEFNYGFQIWTGRKEKTFLFNGMLGQNVLGFWNNGIILVTNAGNDEMFQQSNYFKLALRYFARPFGRGLPENEEALGSLKRLKLAGGEKLPLPEECEKLCSIRLYAQDDMALSVGLMPVIWQAIQNQYTEGLEWIDFTIEDGRLMLHYGEHKVTHHIAVGFGQGEVSEIKVGKLPFLVSAVGRFSTDEDDHPVFQMTVDFLETPCSRKIKLFFLDEETVLLKEEEQPGIGFIRQGVADVMGNVEKRPVIGAAVSKLDRDMLNYRIDRIFAPVLSLKIGIKK